MPATPQERHLASLRSYYFNRLTSPDPDIREAAEARLKTIIPALEAERAAGDWSKRYHSPTVLNREARVAKVIEKWNPPSFEVTFD